MKLIFVLHQSETSPEDFNRVCNILLNMEAAKAFTVSGEAYLKEHGKLVSANALQQLVFNNNKSDIALMQCPLLFILLLCISSLIEQENTDLLNKDICIESMNHSSLFFQRLHL